jgi:hypothetical protein
MMCYYIRLLRLIEERKYYRLLRRISGTNNETLKDCTYMGWLERKGFQLDVRTNCDKFKDFIERFSTEEEGRVITCDDKCMWRISKMQEFSLNFFISRATRCLNFNTMILFFTSYHLVINVF